MRSRRRWLTAAAGLGAVGGEPAACDKGEGEPSARAPGVMRAQRQPGEHERTAEADRKRDEQIESRKRIINRLDAGPQKSELLFQLAEIWIKKAKYVYFQEWADYDARLNKYYECVD